MGNFGFGFKRQAAADPAELSSSFSSAASASPAGASSLCSQYISGPATVVATSTESDSRESQSVTDTQTQTSISSTTSFETSRTTTTTTTTSISVSRTTIGSTSTSTISTTSSISPTQSTVITTFSSPSTTTQIQSSTSTSVTNGGIATYVCRNLFSNTPRTTLPSPAVSYNLGAGESRSFPATISISQPNAAVMNADATLFFRTFTTLLLSGTGGNAQASQQTSYTLMVAGTSDSGPTDVNKQITGPQNQAGQGDASITFSTTITVTCGSSPCSGTVQTDVQFQLFQYYRTN